MFDVICEGITCNYRKRCINYEKRTGVNKCIKPVRFQQKACHHDKHNTCIKCNNFNECTIYLPYNTKLKQIQLRISDILLLLREYGEDDYLTEELRTLRLKEKEKIGLLRRRYLRNTKKGGE